MTLVLCADAASAAGWALGVPFDKACQLGYACRPSIMGDDTRVRKHTAGCLEFAA